MARELEEPFLTDLLSGQLKELLHYVHSDDTLDLQIRENYINIYYRGGSILKVSPRLRSYVFEFDFNYLKSCPFIGEEMLHRPLEAHDWYHYFPVAKQAMDFYYSSYAKEEREYQQLVVRENNYSSIANSTDFFIIDIEYDNRANARFDLVAMEWPSDPSNRRLQNGFKPKLVIFEMKYGDGALNGSSGMLKHRIDFDAFTSDPAVVSAFKDEMLKILEQKRALRLIPPLQKIEGKGNGNSIKEFAEGLELVFLIANHDPESSGLQTELCTMKDSKAKFIASNFCGYGLFQQNVFDMNQFQARYSRQIFNRTSEPAKN